MVLLFNNFETIITDDTTFGNDSVTAITAGSDQIASIWDKAFLFAVVILWISLIGSSFFIDATPAFFVITLILLFGVFYVGGIIANVWGEVSDDTELVATGEFPITTWVFEHFLAVITAIALTSGIALFAKSQG